MFAIISDISNLSGDSVEEVKEKLKGQLRKLGLISESTKELDLDGLSKAIMILKEKRNEYN